MYDFNKIIDRTGSGDLKHEVLLERYGRADLLPLWVADMDFETPTFITEALRHRLDHSLFGYTVEPKNYWPPCSNGSTTTTNGTSSLNGSVSSPAS